jgi:hypothetical protein
MDRLITPPVESPLLRGLGWFGRQESPESLRGSPLFSRDTPFDGDGSVSSSHDEMATHEHEVFLREVSPRQISSRDVLGNPDVKREILSPVEEKLRILGEDERIVDGFREGNVPSRVSSLSEQGANAQVFREVRQISSTESIDAQPEDPRLCGGGEDDMDDDMPPPPPPPSYPPPLLNAATILENRYAPRSLSPARDPRKRPADLVLDIQKNRSGPGQRSVTFSEHNEVHAISPKGASLPVPRRSSMPARMSLESRMHLDADYPDPGPSKRSSETVSNNIPDIDRSPPKRPRGDYTQRVNLTSKTATFNVIQPANVLLTNSYPEWSNYSLVVGSASSRQGLELVDNTMHRSVQFGVMSSKEFLPPGNTLRPVNGAWISPGGVAVLHGKGEANRNRSQVSIIDYPDINSVKGKPIVTHLHARPHRELISVIVPLWVNNVGCRAFATGGICSGL